MGFGSAGDDKVFFIEFMNEGDWMLHCLEIKELVMIDFDEYVSVLEYENLSLS